jgi:hypothetical protein
MLLLLLVLPLLEVLLVFCEALDDPVSTSVLNANSALQVEHKVQQHTQFSLGMHTAELKVPPSKCNT